MKKHLLCIFAALMPLLASAQQVEIEGIWYILNEYQEAQVTQNHNGNTKYSGDITIPATVTYEENSYSVTRIENWAFNECRELTTVTIAENSQLRSIGIAAFQECSALTAINIPKSVTSIEAQAFNGCNRLASINIPEGVTIIERYVFSDCYNLTKINIPAKVTSIEEYAFLGCSSLTAITVDERNTVYDSRGECNAIIKTESNTLIQGCAYTIIPESVTSIEDYAFYGCSKLTTITIPASVTSIGSYTFYGCTNLTSINIPASVTSIKSGAFSSCRGLTAITVDKRNAMYDSRDECNAIIETKSNTLITGCVSTTIPASVKSIGSAAFENCDRLTTITIPEGVTSIEDGAFYSCDDLTTIHIPASVTSIGSSAFAYCRNLETLTFHEDSQLKSIGEGAFYYCSKLADITIPEGVTSIGDYAFDYTAWKNNQIDGVVYAGNILLGYRGDMPENTTIEVKEGTTSIAGNAFNGYTNLTSITIPASVKSIGYAAFNKCTNLTEINIPENSLLDSIGAYAFQNCSNLTAIALPENVTSIGKYAFYECGSLTEINIPARVKDIKDATFAYCNSLATIAIPENSQLTSIGEYAFYQCSNLTKINIPASVISIEYCVFYYCTSLATVNIPENSQLKNIEGGAFYNCPSLTTITLPEGLTDIRFQAFQKCSSLTEITLPESVTNIEQYAFANCPALSNVYCYAKSLPAAEANVFEGSNPENATLHVPASALNMYEHSYPWLYFGNFETIQMEKCATPSISYVDGKFSLTSDTEGAVVVTRATIANEDTYKGLEFEFTTPMLTFTAIATKVRYEDSDEVSLTICWIPCTEDHKEEEENEDNSINIPSNPVLISTQGGTITLSGLAEGTAVAAYSIAGAQLATATATNGTATLATNLPTGSIAIVKIGDYSIRIAIK